MIKLIVGLLVVIFIAVGGFIYFNSGLNSRLNSQQADNITTPQPVNAFDDLKNELNSTDIGASEDDLDEVDADLQSLP